MVKTFTRLIAVFLLMIRLGYAQDTHYSQYYESPLTLNPALTGMTLGGDWNYRVGLLYRNQWHSVTVPYKTPSVSFDINNVLQGSRFIGKLGTLSMGGYLLNDKAGDGNLTNMQILYSVGVEHAWGKTTGPQKLHTSFALQLSYNHMSIDYYRLFFETQFVDPILGFRPYDGTNNGESNSGAVLANSFSYFDANFGAVASYQLNNKILLYGGFALNHLLTPKQSFKNQPVGLNNIPNDLNGKHVVNLGANLMLSSKVSLLPTALIMGQTKSFEANIGTQIGYTVVSAPTSIILYGGLYDRIGDALIPSVAAAYKNVRVGMSYDVNTSSLNVASNSKGGFEISIIYTGLLGIVRFPPPLMNCPRI